MPEQTVTLTIPAAIYDQLKRRAEASGRTVQDEIIEAVAAQASDLPPDVEQTVASLSLLNDAELWQAARTRVPSENTERIEALLRKRGREGLSDEETRALAGLLRFSDRVMLVRAEATLLLKRRGHDVSSLLSAS